LKITPVRVVVSLLVLAPLVMGQSPRRPRGIYAIINIDSDIDQQQKANPSITTAELHAYLANRYNTLLNNPAVSGLALQIGWSTLNPNPTSSAQPYDWSWLDDAFSSVATWNAHNTAAAPKTIQLILFPGYFTPPWTLDQIPSCDGLFLSPQQTPPANCGKATFAGFFEPVGGRTVLPMPWNAFYKSSFKTFLTALAAQYGANPAFVSIPVAGPTAASVEMIVPNNANTPNQSQFGGIAPNDMWLKLLAFNYPNQPAYQRSDQAFIDEWNAAIDMYSQVFSGVTLVSTTGDGLPNLAATGFTVPTAFKDDCPLVDMDCAAETTILTHFVDPTVGGSNAKANQESGMNGRASAHRNNLDAFTAKDLAQRTAQFSSPQAQIVAGEQFGTGFSTGGIAQGCTSVFPPGPADTPAGCSIPSSCTTEACVPVACIPQACLAPGVTTASLAGYGTFGNVPAADLIPPEQSLFNILRNYFNITPAAALFGGTAGTAPVNYLQMYAPDFTYSSAHLNAPAMVVKPDGTSFSAAAQDLLNLGSQQILQNSEDNVASVAPAGPASGGGASQTFTFTFSDTGTWQNLSVVNVLINSALDGRRACYIAFVPSGATSGSLYLVDDAGDAGGPYQGLVLPGGGSISNGQCTIAGSGSSVSTSGDNLTLTLVVTFNSAFAGDKVFYLSSQDKQGNGSGWQALGAWAVPGSTASGPGVGSVSPARSSASSGLFTFTFTDTKGAQDIAVANVLINSAIDGRHACYVAFVPPASLYLVDNTGDAGGPYSGMVIPGIGSVNNSQCTISGTGSSVAMSGNNLTLTLSINFSPGFGGNQIIYMAARSNTASSGWQVAGTVSVP